MPPTSHAPAKTAAASAMSPGLIVLLLSLLLGLQPVTTDLYLPALPALTEALVPRWRRPSSP
jgi:DHA1 family bicyclomycin/chloramphenicol resistance-like MFS transporter